MGSISKGIKRMTEEDLPCYQCLCLPICRRKLMNALLKCSIVSGYLNGPPVGPVGSDYAPLSTRIDFLLRYLRLNFI